MSRKNLDKKTPEKGKKGEQGENPPEACEIGTL
jgi:hypothetical protein